MSLYQSPNLYDLYYNPDNEGPLKKHYQHVLAGKDIKTIHDCSFGTGNLSFVLHDMGYVLSGSDLSQDMINQAKVKARDRDIDIPLLVEDFTCLDLDKTYDMIMSTGNSLPHVDEDALVDALISMKKHIKPGGYLYLDLRNWDNILDHHKRFQAYPPVIKEDERTNMVLVRDFLDHKVVFNFIYTFEKNNKLINSEVQTVEYYPIRKDRLIEILKGLGFEKIELFNFINPDIKAYDQMAWYCLLCKHK